MESLVKVPPSDSMKRIDKLLAEKTGITRSRIQSMLDEGLITVGGKPVKANYRVREGDEIVITPAKPLETGALIAEDLPINILYADSHIVVVDKPAGMVVYPSAGHPRGTLMNALKLRLGNLASVGGPLRPGVVHRLDKDTSGVMVVALSDEAYYGLVEQFKTRAIDRSYVALLYGAIKGERGEISLPVGRSESDRKKMSTRTRRGKMALTSWEAIERFYGATLIRAKLGTGRTHQIRVHFASVGHPVLGDRTYGKKISIEFKRPPTNGKGSLTLSRQMLHAGLLGLTHPVTGKYMEFRSPLPEDMETVLSKLRQVKQSEPYPLAVSRRNP